MIGRILRGCGCLTALLAIAAPVFSAQDYKNALPADHPAIQYATAPVDDPVQRLARALEQGQLTWSPRKSAVDFVPDVLRHLRIATDTQMLVFSKTSLQAAHISPARPRAIYFADAAFVAYVPGASTVELAAIDARQGPIFYALSADAGRPSIARSTSCLRCHQGPNTEGVPGIYVGSVIPGPTGAPLRDDSAIITDHRTPFADRWGGWYVTARRGEQPDRANAVAENPADPETLVRDSRQNLVTLDGRFDLKPYLAETSDIVALLVFEHQTQMTNLLTRVNWEWRIGGAAPSVDELLRYMLFSGEAPIVEPIEGVSSFARTFPTRGPRDARGRSLRDLDLKTRLFRYPLSYLIYSASFDALPDGLRAEIYRRLHDVLTGRDRDAVFAHLSVDDRRAIIEILRATKMGLPAYFLTKS